MRFWQLIALQVYGLILFITMGTFVIAFFIIIN